MQVILKESVRHLGELGEIVSVKAGYARNYLLPQGLAVPASDRQLSRLKHEQALIERKIVQLRDGASLLAEKLNGLVVTVEKAAGQSGKLFGSVTSMEVESLLAGIGYEIERRQIRLTDNIKTVGQTPVELRLHRDVVATITVNVIGVHAGEAVEANAEEAPEEPAEESAED